MGRSNNSRTSLLIGGVEICTQDCATCVVTLKKVLGDAHES